MGTEDADQAAGTRDSAEGADADAAVPVAEEGPQETSLSPVALRILGAQRSSAQLAQMRDVSARRLRVALGDDWIDVVLAEAPAVNQGKPRQGQSWLAATPYLVWAPLPHDVPEGGDAFVCVGVSDEGCLFIDLAAAPGAVAIGGDRGAAGRLAESMAHQLCMAVAAGQPCTVIAVGATLPQPLPPCAQWRATPRDLKPAPPQAKEAGRRAEDTGTRTDDETGTEVVFCELRSNEEAFALARYTNIAPGRVVPVILANLPDAPWSFTAQPRHPPGEAISQVIA